jgi:hypothetical protein
VKTSKGIGKDKKSMGISEILLEALC